MRLLDGKKPLKIQMSHEMNEKGMESSILLKLGMLVEHPCDNH
jgi:hypothetical protein